jgi:hypothetical protein
MMARSPRICAAACAVVVTALLAAAAAGAETPLPAVAAGSGSGSTSAHGTLLGGSFVARAAIVQRDFYGALNLYLFSALRGCGSVTAADAPYLWLSIDSGGERLTPGQALRTAGAVHVTASAVSRATRVVLPSATTVVFANVDPKVRSVWHGTVALTGAAAASSKKNSVAGPFSARWCGSA